MSKQQRQHRIARLLETSAVASQAELVERLAAEGIEATQATVSRDLEELGAVKVRLPGGESAYALPELPSQQVAPEEHLRRVLGDWVVELDVSANLVVLRTPPGSAHVVGSALDRSGFRDVIGTVAGDDTVLVVAAESAGGADVADRLAGLAGLDGDRRGAPPDGGGRDGATGGAANASAAASGATDRSTRASPKAVRTTGGS